eukprot:gene2841-5588_t
MSDDASTDLNELVEVPEIPNTAAYDHPSLRDNFRLSMWIPKEQVGKVIGKKGVVILHIQRETQAKVIMNPPTVADSHWSPVLVLGDPSKTLSAYRMVRELVDDVDDVIAEFPIPRQKHQRIVGSGGITIRTISAKTNVRIWVPSYKEVDRATGDHKYVLDAIIGQVNGIGVENLRGSGLIAGETSRAYDETFTLSYVTGRSVGIGAYLNRLGQRVIQMQQGPMILTGYSALNKLLGKEVYTSQDQLGGPQIMFPNGVTHEVVTNDQEGMQSVIDWLSYTPSTFTGVAPTVPYGDPVDRPIGFQPTKAPYDPRHMLAGVSQMDGSFTTGFFDRGSFKEYLGGWGKSVIVGRARLGGQPVGVISVETRLVEQRIPADPGNPDSRESILPQAGQVWYPDSAFKTAQAIQDFNRGENLPLIIFANWRGFSGGTRDMYGEVLKYGAMIVDSLRTYRHPVFVYIPPNGELRGGAWVVIDPTINPAKMEMYADVQSRGGILEPPGICEVKYRSSDQKHTMHRLDPVLQELDGLSSDGKDITGEITQREKNLAPVYTQIAHEFADLHDRTGRMVAKGCIRQALTWQTSRRFFFWRIKFRLLRDALVAKAAEAMAQPADDKDCVVGKMVDVWLSGVGVSPDDELASRWLESDQGVTAQSEWIKKLKETRMTAEVKATLEGLPEDVIQALLSEIRK